MIINFFLILYYFKYDINNTGSTTFAAMFPGQVAAPVFRPPGPPQQEQTPTRTVATFAQQTALVQQPVAYAIPPPGVPSSQNAPRGIFTPSVSMATPQPLMQPTYITTPIMTYPAQPPPPTGPPSGPYPIQGHVAMQTFAPQPQVWYTCDEKSHRDKAFWSDWARLVNVKTFV